jgi:hypothetical protein
VKIYYKNHKNCSLSYVVVYSFVPYSGNHKLKQFPCENFVELFLLVLFLQSTGMGVDPDPSFRFDADQDPTVHIDADPGPDPAPH